MTWRVEERKIEERDGGPYLVFDWVERGVPLDEREPRRKGFGTVVLGEMLAHNLKAEASFTFTPDGLRYRMAMPLTSRTLQGDAVPLSLPEKRDGHP